MRQGELVSLRSLPRSIQGEVFPGLTTEAVKRAYARAVRRAAIEDLRFHDLRHEATSRLFEKGLNIMEVAIITGHRPVRDHHLGHGNARPQRRRWLARE